MLLKAILADLARKKKGEYKLPDDEYSPNPTTTDLQPLPREASIQRIYDEAGVGDEADPITAFKMLSNGRQLEIIEQELSTLSDNEKAQIKEALTFELSRPMIPNPGPQTMAYNSTADVLLYGGAAGGGKTALIVGLAAQEHERSLILRRQSTELDGIVQFSREILSRRGKYNATDKEWTLADGRSIKMGGCKEEEDWRAYAGRARDLLALDEAGEFLEIQVLSLSAWLRTTNPNQRTRLVLASNPPRGPEGQWLVTWFAPWLDPKFPNRAQPGELRYFIRVGDDIEWVDGPGKYYRNEEEYTARSATFIPALLADNPYLANSEYRGNLQSLPEPLRSQLLYGDFLSGKEDGAWQVIPSEWVEAAMKRWEKRDRPRVAMTSLGVDVAQGGSDKTSLAPLYDNYFEELKILKGVDTKDGPAVAGQAFVVMRDGCPVVIDMGGGWGGSAKTHLENQNVKVVGVNPGAGSTKKTAEGLNLANMRSELWWSFREALDPVNDKQICLPRSESLKADLTTPTWKLTSRGVLIQSKEEIRKKLGRSTDEADAVLLAWNQSGDVKPKKTPRNVTNQKMANLNYQNTKDRRLRSVKH